MSHLRMPEGSSPSNLGAAFEEGSIPLLSPQALHSMTQQQLQEFITCLTPLMPLWTNLGTEGGGLLAPKGKKWTTKTTPAEASPSATSTAKEAMVVPSPGEAASGCNRLLGQEGQLWDSCPAQDWRSWLSKTTGNLLIRKAKGLPDFPAARKLSMWPPGQADTPVKSFVAVYLCIHCDTEFSTKEQLKQHQDSCPMQTQPLSAQTPLSHPAPSGPGSAKSKGRRLKRLQITPQPSSTSSAKTPGKGNFMDRLGLIPKESLESVRARHAGEVACEKLDLAEPETPISPTSPRTPRLLLTQISREGETCPVSKRRLSYLQPPQTPTSDSESTGSEECESVPPVRSLLSIDFSSLLGLRVAKHLKQEDNSVHLVRDAETYCRTPVKNQFLEKLRNRTEMYSTTYRPTRKRLRQHNHVYKFTRRQRKEFMERINTGLNPRSRKLLSCLRKCSVAVYKLTKADLDKWLSPCQDPCVRLTAISESDIEQWCAPKVKKEGASIFPDIPLMEDANVEKYLGLRCTNARGSKPIKQLQLSMSHLVSEDENAEAVGLMQAVVHSYLSDVSHSRSPSPASSLGKSQNLRFRGLSRCSMNLNVQDPLEINIPPNTYSPSSLLSDSSGNRPSDDCISILTVSSEEGNAKNPDCCSGCRQSFKMKPSLSLSPSAPFLKVEDGDAGRGSPCKMRRQSSSAGPSLRSGGLSPGGLGASGAYSLRSQDFKTRSGQPWGQTEQSPRKRGMSQSEQGPKLTFSSSMPTLVSMLNRPVDSEGGSGPKSDTLSSTRKRKIMSLNSSSAMANDQAVASESTLTKSRAEEQGFETRRQLLHETPPKTKPQSESVSDALQHIQQGLKHRSSLEANLLSLYSIGNKPSTSNGRSSQPSKLAFAKAKSAPAAGIKNKMSSWKKSSAGFLNPRSYKRSRSRRKKPPALEPVSSCPASSSSTRASTVTGFIQQDRPPKLEKMTDSPSKSRLG